MGSMTIRAFARAVFLACAFISGLASAADGAASGTTSSGGASQPTGDAAAAQTSASAAPGANDKKSVPETPGTISSSGLSYAPESVDFGKQSIGTTSVVQEVIISSKTAVKFHDIQAAGDFKVSDQTASCSIPAGGSCPVRVTFSPKQPQTTELHLIAHDDSGATLTLNAVRGSGVDVCACGLLSHCGWATQLVFVGTLAALYLLALVVVRWNLVALPTRRLLDAEVEAVLIRIEGLEHHLVLHQARLARFKEVLKHIRTELKPGFWKAGFDALFWSRGQEISAWGMVHEVEEQLVDFYPTEVLRAQLERTESQLRENSAPAMQNLASRIDVALQQTVAVLSDVQRSALEEARAFIESVNAGLRKDLLALCGQQQPIDADCLAMARRILLTLNPGATSLDASLTAALVAGVPKTTPEFESLLAHTQSSVLGAYRSAATGLQNGVDAPNPYTAAQWMPILANQLIPLFDEMIKFDGRLKAALDAASKPPLERWRALLSEGLGVIYDRSDIDFASLVAWHNKTMWLTTCGLVLIVALGLALGNGPLFLLGATGGLLSRLSRSLYRQDVQTDYGASWTTLFLSPVVGAITGWAGVLLAALLVKFNILGTLFSDVGWSGCNLISLGIALMFGFSERAFDTVLSQLQDKVVNKSSDGAANAPSVTITTDGTLVGGKVGAAYEQPLAASGGTPKYKWSVASGKLPDGLKLDDVGQKIAGSPTASGNATFSLVATDQAGIASKAKSFTLNIAAPN